MDCIHIAKHPNQRQYRITPHSTGIQHRLCESCFEIYENDPRKSPRESEAYNIYQSTDPNLPKDQWTLVNEKPIPRTSDNRMQFLIKSPAPGSHFYIKTLNAVGLDSLPSKVITMSESNVVLKSILTFGENTDEGKLVEAVNIPWFEILDILAKDPGTAFSIPPDKWEEIIAGAYQRAGFDEVTLTPRSGDYGRDVIAVKKGLGTVRVIDQVKAYKKEHLVTANDVRALVGVLHGDGASKGFLTTTSDFAPKLRSDPLIAPFMPSRLELINGENLLSRLLELRRS